MSEDGWVNVELKYLGSIKMRNLEIIELAEPKHYKYSDGDLEYTLWLYKFWSDQKSFQKDAEISGFYDADFDTEAAIQYEKGKRYVYCYGRKITWMQYNTSKKTVFENVPSRIGHHDGRWKNTLYMFTSLRMTQKRMDIWQIWSMRDNGKRANVKWKSILYCIAK